MEGGLAKPHAKKPFQPPPPPAPILLLQSHLHDRCLTRGITILTDAITKLTLPEDAPATNRSQATKLIPQ